MPGLPCPLFMLCMCCGCRLGYEAMRDIHPAGPCSTAALTAGTEVSQTPLQLNRTMVASALESAGLSSHGRLDNGVLTVVISQVSQLSAAGVITEPQASAAGCLLLQARDVMRGSGGSDSVAVKMWALLAYWAGLVVLTLVVMVLKWPRRKQL
jgi:hypothetical protein